MTLPAPLLDWRHKGLPATAQGSSAAQLSVLDIDILRGDCLYPVAVLKDAALAHNGAWMKRFVAHTSALLCPHGKTTMSPELFAQQLADGAWGHHRRHRQPCSQLSPVRHKPRVPCQSAGRSRQYRLHSRSARRRSRLRFLCPGRFCRRRGAAGGCCTCACHWAADQLAGRNRRTGGRTGVRDHATGLAVARAVAAAAPFLALRGVEAFEGIFQSGDADPAPVGAMLDRLLALATDVRDAGLFAAGEVILSAGGSGFFDLCADRLARSGLAEAKVVLRSGCYIAHDNGLYDRLFAQIRARNGDLPADGLRPALEVWTVIQSAPEPGRVIAALGKRDIGNDVEMPRPLWWFREGQHDCPQPMPGGYAVPALYDQHAFVDGPDLLQVGDLIGFGVSHPCTTFDKWRMLFTVDDDYRVTGAVTTWF